MQNSIQIVFLNIFICIFFGFLIGPLVNLIGHKFNIIDEPNFRKIHKSPIVRIGGLTIFLTFLLFYFFNYIFLNVQDTNFFNQEKTLIIIIGACSYFFLGLHDDIFRSSPFFRLIIQTLVALIITYSGINISSVSLNFPFFQKIFIELPLFFEYLFTCLWIVGLTNAINWLDGFDGLAAGFCSIVSIGLASHMFFIGNFNGLLFFIVLAGSTIGFLTRNIRPSYYIMGDCGSYFLGFCLSVGTIFFIPDLSNNSLSFGYLIILFSLPLFDMSFVILKRLLNKSNPFKADSTHIHHRLIKKNFTYSSIIFIVYLYTIGCVFIANKFLI